MHVLRRAFWSVSRRISQSILLLLTLLVIGTMVFASLSIQSATKRAEQEARMSMGSEVILKSYDESGKGQIELLPIEVAESLTTLNHVKDFNYITHWNYAAKNFNAIPSKSMDGVDMIISGESSDSFIPPNLSVDAVLETSQLVQFQEGMHILEEGRHITQDDGSENLALIERVLAEENELQLGDKLELARVDGVKIELTIVGIYKTNRTINDVMLDYNLSFVPETLLPYNMIYSPFHALTHITKTDSGASVMIGEAVYHIDDPLHVSSFVEQVESNQLIDSTKFKLHTNEEKIKRISLAINNVAAFSTLMLWLVIGSGVVILCLLLIYFVKGRMREMGILLSLGESSVKISLQLMTETGVLVLLAFSLSIFSGNIVAEQAGNRLITKQIESIEQESQRYIQGAIVLNVAEDMQGAMINTLEMHISLEVWVRLIYVTCAILFASSLFPAMVILRLKPRAILGLQE